jgi:N-acyl-D-aspartate/D-glutamate deacylase
MAADILVFDPGKLEDRASFDKPLQFAEGMAFVLVNGVPVIDGGKFTAANPGRVLRHGR